MINISGFLNKRKTNYFRVIACALILVIVLALGFFQTVYAEESGQSGENGESALTELVKQNGAAVDWQTLQEFFDELESSAYSDKTVFEIFEGLIGGEYTVSGATFIEYIFEIFFARLKNVLPSIITVVIIAILCGILAKSKSELFGGSTSELIFFVCFSAIIITVLTYVWSYVEATKKTLLQIKTLTNLVMPTLLAFMSAIGSKVSLAVYQPTVALLSGGIIELATNVIMPLVIVTFVFTVVSNLSNNIRLEKITAFFKSLSMSLFGIAFTVFSAFLTVQGINANVFDSVSLRAAKYATKNYVPILGGYLAEGLDLVLASSVLVKNAFGVVALVILTVVIAIPVVELLAFNLLLQLAAGLIEPITDHRIVKFLSAVSKNISLLVVIILGVAFMFFVVTLLIISTANVF